MEKKKVLVCIVGMGSAGKIALLAAAAKMNPMAELIEISSIDEARAHMDAESIVQVKGHELFLSEPPDLIKMIDQDLLLQASAIADYKDTPRYIRNRTTPRNKRRGY